MRYQETSLYQESTHDLTFAETGTLPLSYIPSSLGIFGTLISLAAGVRTQGLGHG